MKATLVYYGFSEVNCNTRFCVLSRSRMVSMVRRGIPDLCLLTLIKMIFSVVKKIITCGRDQHIVFEVFIYLFIYTIFIEGDTIS